MSKPRHAKPDVFLIDDDPVFVAIGEVLFKEAGASSVSSIGNSTVALNGLTETASANTLVVVNLNMRGLDGLAVMRILSVGKFKGWVVITSNEVEAIRESASRLARLLGLRYAGELEKPLREAEIAQIMQVMTENAGNATLKAGLSHVPQKIVGIKPVYQPKLDAMTGEIVGAESLMRLETSDGALISPFAHIEKLTRDGTLTAETLKFLDMILQDMVAWKSAGYFPVISVNAPAPVIENPEFLVDFARRVRAQGISPSQLTLELTESVLPSDPSYLVEVLTRLRMTGFGLALDDFGTGMANFDMLRMCPFSELKIDRSLAQAAVHDPLSCGIIETCATISRELGMTLVAEGIETEAQELALRRLGVNVFQGFLFGKGVVAADFTRSLQQDEKLLARA